MMDWACRLCMTLPEGEGLELHIQAHARESVWSYDEVSEAVRELRELFGCCDTCRVKINRDLRPPTMAESWAELSRALNAAIEETWKSLLPWYAKLREAGLLPEEPPADPKARALWARQNRSTGPARPSGPTAKRPRRHN